jgi:hypothetical protein
MDPVTGRVDVRVVAGVALIDACNRDRFPVASCTTLANTAT